MAVSGLGIFTTDTSLVIRTWDEWIASASGIAATAAIGRPLTDVVPDLEPRGLLGRFHDALTAGTAHVLVPAFHRFLIKCPVRNASTHFAEMQQRVTIGPLRDDLRIIGVIVAIEDVTARLDQERALAEALQSSDADVRRAASEAVAAAARIENPAAFSPALRDPNWRVRAAAVDGLAQSQDADFVLALIDSLRRDHRHFSLLSSALKLLAVTDVDVAEPLIGLLADADPDLRIQAALALGDQQGPAAITALIRALDDADINVRFQAIESLGRLRAAAAVDDLLAIVETRDFFLAFPALDALAAIGDPRVGPELAARLGDDDLRVAVADALATLGDDRAIRPLVEALNRSAAGAVPMASAIVQIHDRYDRQYQDGARITDLVRDGLDARGRGHVLDAVGAAPGDRLPVLVRLLGWLEGHDVVRALTGLLSDDAARAEVIEALVRHGEGVVEAVLEQLDADDERTRYGAIVALGRLGSRRASAKLVAWLGHDDAPLVAIAGALARIGDPAASDPLLPLLGHSDGAVRQAAIGALNSIGHPELPGRIADLLMREDPLVRESAVRIAGYFGYQQTAQRLIELAHDPEEAVRAAAIEQLAFIDDPRALPTLLTAVADDTARSRAAAARALAKVDSPGAGAALVRALDDADSWVRYYATRALAEQRDNGAVAPLMRLAESDPVPHVRIAALDALGVLDAHAVVDEIRKLTADEDGNVAAAALAALGRLAGSEGLPDLQQALRSIDSARRVAAVRGLALLGTERAVQSLEWSALADPDAQVVQAAVDALEAMATKDHADGAAAAASLYRMLEDRSRREHAARALARLPIGRLPDVARGLQHPSATVRCQVVDVLGRLQHEAATAFVVESLRDTDAEVRETAVAVLTRLGARSMESVYTNLAAHDPSKRVRRAAAAALAGLRVNPA